MTEREWLNSERNAPIRMFRSMAVWFVFVVAVVVVIWRISR